MTICCEIQVGSNERKTKAIKYGRDQVKKNVQRSKEIVFGTKEIAAPTNHRVERNEEVTHLRRRFERRIFELSAASRSVLRKEKSMKGNYNVALMHDHV